MGQSKLSRPLPLGLALIAGLGFILMLTALGLGAGEPNSDTNALGSVFGLGLTLFLFGFIAWLVAVRPWEHFDDINRPGDPNIHIHDEDEDHALVTTTDHGVVETHAHTHS